MTKNKKAQQPEPLPVVDSLKTASASWGFTVDILKQCKKAGCPAFRHGRIYHKEFIKWFDENRDKIESQDPKREWEIRRLKAQCRQIEFRQKVEEGNYTANDKIYASIAHAAQRMKAVLRQKLEVEYPTLLAGADVTEHRIKGLELVDEICKIFSDGTDKWTP
jgi:hypothetical protein